MLNFSRGCGTRLRVPPRLRDTLTRGFWIGEGRVDHAVARRFFTHAKDAKDAKGAKIDTRNGIRGGLSESRSCGMWC
jgi:hypothetical protein